jgi:hypothetical protein
MQPTYRREGDPPSMTDPTRGVRASHVTLDDEAIRNRAYEIWQKGGYPDGSHEELTLFVPSQRVFSVHGPFERRARGWSAHLWLERRRILAGDLFMLIWRAQTRQSEVSSLAIPASPDEEPFNLATHRGTIPR